MACSLGRMTDRSVVCESVAPVRRRDARDLFSWYVSSATARNTRRCHLPSEGGRNRHRLVSVPMTFPPPTLTARPHAPCLSRKPTRVRTSLFEGMCGFSCSRRARARREREPRRVDWSEDIAGASCPVSTLSSTARPHTPYLSRQPRRALMNLSKGACGVGCSGRARVHRGREPRRINRPESTSGASPSSFSLQIRAHHHHLFLRYTQSNI